MTALSATPRFDRTSFVPLADFLTVGVAAALPWSTSATGIFIALWLVVALLTVNPAAFRRELFSAVDGLPVLLCSLGAVGMLWADVSWTRGGRNVVGVPVHDDIFQGSEFLICGFGALGYAVIESSKHKYRDRVLFGLIGSLFLANFAFAEFSRITLLVAPVLIALLGWAVAALERIVKCVSYWRGARSCDVGHVTYGSLAYGDVFHITSGIFRHQ